jgi:hypothetical protein
LTVVERIPIIKPFRKRQPTTVSLQRGGATVVEAVRRRASTPDGRIERCRIGARRSWYCRELRDKADKISNLH